MQVPTTKKLEMPFPGLGTVVNFSLRSIRSGIENTTHGVLRILNLGCKKKVPKVTNDILLQPAVVLAAKIRQGKLTSEEVVKAYISRIEEINGLINAVIDNRFQDALQDARHIDQLIQSGSLTESQMAEEYPLLGVPFTAKEALLIQGLSSTCGLVCRKGLTAAEDCEPVQRLRRWGAIPLGLTNTSEVCMWWETYNKLHGRTNNPYDTTRTVGGSSGGEAALIAAAGSVIGLGTDLGGSIRLPAFFTGIYGHKPSHGLVPANGQFPPALDEVQPYVVVGPMTRYASDLRLVLAALVGKETAHRLSLYNPVDLRSIKVYYMLDDGGNPLSSTVSSDIKEAMQKVVNMLSMEGLVVQKVNLNLIKFGAAVWCAYLSKIKKQRISNLMKGEVKVDDRESLHHELIKFAAGKSEHTWPIIFNACAQDYLAPVFKKPLDFFLKCGDELKMELLSILNPGPAVFLYPTFPYAAAHHGQIMANVFNVGYTVTFNAVGLPVTQCPLGFNSSGLPYGMQIVTAPNNDVYSIAIAEYLENKLGGWVEPS